MKTCSDTLCVVGDKFHTFATGAGAITISDLLKRIRTSEIGDAANPVRLVAGQGLKDHEIEHLRRVVSMKNLHDRLIIELTPEMPRADRIEAHKHHPENIMISLAKQVGEREFVSSLVLDERSEIMADHVTGHHIQGMALVEAARQMFLVVTEQYYLPLSKKGEYYFVIHEMDVSFQNFVFPVAATVHYEVLEQATDNPARLSFKARIVIRQAGRDAATVLVSFTAFDQQVIASKERERAQQTLKSVIESLPAAQRTQRVVAFPSIREAAE